MLDNEFDQFFRDRLLDHPSKIRLSIWKQVHTHLLRHKAFHFWKWYFVGPSAVAVFVAGHFILRAIQPPSPTKHTAPAAGVATYNARPGADSPTTQAMTASDSPAATPGTTQAASTPDATPGTTQAASTPDATPAAASPAVHPNTTTTAAVHPNTAATAANANTATHPATADATSTPAGGAPATPTSANAIAKTPTPAAAAITHNARRNNHPAITLAGAKGSSTNTRHRHHAGAHGQEAGDEMTADATAAGAKAANDARVPNGIASAHNAQPDATQRGVTRAPTQPAPLKLITLKTPAVVMAKTPNPKSPHQLTLPAPRPHTHIPINLDLFGAPEYFTWNTIGLSYSAGARVTVIFKNHWTITTGLQFEKVNVNHVKEIDSLSGLLPGKFNNFHIPLLLGYTTGNDRFSLSVNAGVLFSLYTQANGSLSQADNWPSHEGISSYLGVNFSSHITNKVSLFAEPYLKCWYIPGDQRLPPQLWSTGVIVGLRYNF